MRGWACDRCETVHTQNAKECRSCGYHVLRPVSAEELERLSSGVEEPDSAQPDTVGATPEPSFESSPDVAADGSINRSDEDRNSEGLLARLKKFFS